MTLFSQETYTGFKVIYYGNNDSVLMPYLKSISLNVGGTLGSNIKTEVVL
jgi:hypothetical protein